MNSPWAKQWTRAVKYKKSEWDLAEWYRASPANAKFATVLGSIPASSDRMTVDEAVLNTVLKKLNKKIIKISKKLYRT